MMGIKGDIFYLKFTDNYFNKGDILIPCPEIFTYKIKVLETPHKKWWKQFLQFITFELYKAPTRYKRKVIE